MNVCKVVCHGQHHQCHGSPAAMPNGFLSGKMDRLMAA
jgi:hypothetical protein